MVGLPGESYSDKHLQKNVWIKDFPDNKQASKQTETVALLYTKDKWAEKEIRETTPYIIAIKIKRTLKATWEM